MTDKLTPEQRKRVAEAVTREKCTILDGRVWVHYLSPDGGVIFGKPTGDTDHRPWAPRENARMWKALSQFLALQYQFKGDDLQDELFVACIADNNTEALERMAYEILEAQSD